MNVRRIPSFASRLFPRGLGLALVGIVACSVAGAQENELLKYIPPSANAIVVIDADALMNTELAVREKWQDKRAKAYAQRPIAVPPEASGVIIAAQLDAAHDLERRWEISVIGMPEKMPMSAVARAEGGYVDTINGASAVWTPTEAYFVELPGTTLGTAFPGDRKAVSQWIDFTRNAQKSVVSDYLQAAAAGVDAKTQIVMALDLKDVPQPHLVRERLAASPLVRDDDNRINQLADLIVGIQGIKLSISVTNRILGELRVDFADNTSVLGELAKPLLLETMDNLEVHLDELEKWSASVEGNSIVLKGTLTEDSMRRVTSLLELPSTKFSELQGVEEATPGSTDYVQASQTYYTSVMSLIDDLRRTLKERRDNHAVWMENYGRKIDALPILNVDEELVGWGAMVAETFRAVSVSEKSAGVRSGVRKSKVYGNYVYSGYGYDTYKPGSVRKTEIQREEFAEATMLRFDSWKEIEDASADIRRKMTQKYGVEF